MRLSTWEPSYLGLYITQSVEILYTGLLLYTCVCISTLGYGCLFIISSDSDFCPWMTLFDNPSIKYMQIEI